MEGGVWIAQEEFDRMLEERDELAAIIVGLNKKNYNLIEYNNILVFSGREQLKLLDKLMR